MIWMDSVQANICYSNDSENSMGVYFEGMFRRKYYNLCLIIQEDGPSLKNPVTTL